MNTIELVKTIILGVVTFAATNLDDFLLLLLLFSLGNISTYKIVLGQYLGMVGILVLSFYGGSAGANLIPSHWVGILGVIPLSMGIGKLYQKYQTKLSNSSSMSNSSEAGQNLANIQLLNKSPSKIGIFTIAFMTLTNGGDNIAVYAPLFAERTNVEIILLISVFLFLTAIWCLGGSILTSQKKLKKVISRMNTDGLPYILIAIGLIILLNLH